MNATAEEIVMIVAAAKGLVAPLPSMIGVALMLFGSFTAQTYTYWFSYGNDKIALKAMVIVLWLLECLHSALCLHIMQWYFVGQIGNPVGMLHIVWSVPAGVVLEITIIAICETFYLYRLWQFSGKKITVVILPLILVICRVGASTVSIAMLIIYPAWTEFHDHTSSRLSMTIGMACGALMDILVTAFLAFYLQRYKTSFRRTRHMIERLIHYTINTGAITSIVSIAALVTYNVLPKELVFGGFIQLLSKLYANSVLAMLNARHSLKEQGTANNTLPAQSIPLQFKKTSNTTSGSETTRAASEVTANGDSTVHVGSLNGKMTDTESLGSESVKAIPVLTE